MEQCSESSTAPALLPDVPVGDRKELNARRVRRDGGEGNGKRELRGVIEPRGPASPLIIGLLAQLSLVPARKEIDVVGSATYRHGRAGEARSMVRPRA